MTDQPIRHTCDVCRTTIFWIPNEIQGGWWAHETHPADDHDAEVEMLPECCTWRDHEFACACPEHEYSAMHPFGGGEERWGKPPTDDG